MDDKLTLEILITRLDLFQHIQSAREGITSRIDLDDYALFDKNEILLLETELNELYSEFTFEVVPVFSGFAQDLLITNKLAKEKYDSIPKSKTYGDVYRYLYEKHGIHSSGTFVDGLSEKITDKEFDSLVNFHLSLSEKTKEAFK